MPLKYKDKIIGVAQLINKENGSNGFTPTDVKDFDSFLVLCGIAIRNADVFLLSFLSFFFNIYLFILLCFKLLLFF